MQAFSKSLFLISCGGLLVAQTPIFKQGPTVSTLAGPLASTTGDFNLDGHLDLAISNTAVKSISILLGAGDGSFRSPVVYSTGACQPGQVITGDFNRDGHLDLLSSCTLTNSIMVLPGKGDGTFGSPIFTATSFPVVSGFLDNFVEPLTAADVNGDGILDLALIIQTTQTVGLNSSGAVGQSVLMTGKGDGTFVLARTLTIVPPGTEPYAVQLADVNGDGKADIVGICFNYNAAGLTNPLAAFFFVALNDGTGSFQLAHSYPLTGIPQTGMLIQDINADGKLDIVFAGLSIAAILNDDTTDFSGVGVFIGAGDGSFALSYSVVDSQSTENQATVGSALAPVLGTKYPDLIGLVFYQDLSGNGPATGAVIVRPNKGDGTFGPPQNLSGPSAALPFSISVGDFNSDGKPDLLIMNFSVNLLDLLFSEDILDNIDNIGGGIATFPAASASILLNGAASATFTDTNAASFKAGAVATSSIVSAFGTGLATGTQSASGSTLPLSLDGTSIAVTDALGVTRAAPLFYVSPTQINFAIPDGTAIDTATVTITTPTGVLKSQQSIVSVAPGVFNSGGFALGQVFTYNGGITPVVTSTVQIAGSQLGLTPIDVGTGTTSAFLILYGTGLRNHKNTVTATIGTTTVAAAYAGLQSVYVGEDQINIQLPQSLKGAGVLNLTLNVDGQITNPVQILIR